MRRIEIFLNFGIGLIFSLGLCISGMVRPSKIKGFLDITGNWDPDLLFVMGGAVSVYALVFHFIVKKQKKPVFADTFSRLSHKAVFEPKLVVGSAIFGIGWGLGGFCPGPALVGLASGSFKVLIFVGAMLMGIKVATLIFKQP